MRYLILVILIGSLASCANSRTVPTTPAPVAYTPPAPTPTLISFTPKNLRKNFLLGDKLDGQVVSTRYKIIFTDANSFEEGYYNPETGWHARELSGLVIPAGAQWEVEVTSVFSAGEYNQTLLKGCPRTGFITLLSDVQSVKFQFGFNSETGRYNIYADFTTNSQGNIIPSKNERKQYMFTEQSTGDTYLYKREAILIEFMTYTETYNYEFIDVKTW